jgi:hypothetical protein
MPQVGMKDLLHASILSFDYFKIYEWRIINALQRLKKINVSRKFFCE